MSNAPQGRQPDEWSSNSNAPKAPTTVLGLLPGVAFLIVFIIVSFGMADFTRKMGESGMGGLGMGDSTKIFTIAPIGMGIIGILLLIATIAGFVKARAAAAAPIDSLFDASGKACKYCRGSLEPGSVKCPGCGARRS
jgi:hypothetical protein